MNIKNFWEQNKGTIISMGAFISMAIFATIIIKFFSAKENVKTFYKTPAKEIVGEVVKNSYFNCFNSDLKTYWCNPSAIAYNRDFLIIGNDKNYNNNDISSLIKFDLNEDYSIDDESREYFNTPILSKMEKIEAMATDQYRRLMLISTAFDREDPAFNVLALVVDNKFDNALIVESKSGSKEESSLLLKEKLQSALRSKEYPQGLPYFKVEGVTFIPGNKLLFGLRETGYDYKIKNYTHLIVEADYLIINGLMNITNLNLIYDMSLRAKGMVKQDIGLSSLEYDFNNDRLYILSSYEDEAKQDEGLGGYIWYISLSELYQNKMANLLKDEYEAPIMFAHKSEGVAIIDQETILIVHDDDKILGRDPSKITDVNSQFSKTNNNAAYTILKIRPKESKK